MLGLWFVLNSVLLFVCWFVLCLVVGFCLMGVFVCVLLGEKLFVDSISGQGSARHVSLSLISMLAVALSAMRLGRPGLVRCIKGFVE